MSLLAFQRAMADMAAQPALCRRILDEGHAALASRSTSSGVSAYPARAPGASSSTRWQRADEAAMSAMAR